MGKSTTDYVPTVQIVTTSGAGVAKKDSATSSVRRRHKQKRWRQLQLLLRQLKEARGADLVMLQQLREELNHRQHQTFDTKGMRKLEQELSDAREEIKSLRKENKELQHKVDHQKEKYQNLAQQMRIKKEKINKAIDVVDKYKTKNQNLHARLSLCTCQMNPQSAGSQPARRPKRHSRRAKSAQSSHDGQQKSPQRSSSGVPDKSLQHEPKIVSASAATHNIRAISQGDDAESAISEEDEKDLPVPKELSIPLQAISPPKIKLDPTKISTKIKNNVEYWDEKELLARQAAEEAAELGRRDGKSVDQINETSSESLEPAPKPVVDTRIPGFFLQESPAEAWRRRKEAAARRKKDKKQGRVKVHVDPWADRFKRKEPEVKKESEFLLRAKKIGHAMQEHVVEAAGAVKVGAGIIVTAKGVEYHGQAALDRAEEEKRLKEEQELREQEEWEEREIARMEAEAQRELEEKMEKEEREAEEKRRRTEERARQIAESEAREAQQRVDAEAKLAAAKSAAEEEARQKAEEEAKQKAEEAKRKAEEEAKKAAESPAPGPTPPPPPAPAPTPAAPAPAKKKKGFLDSSSDESDDSPVVKKAPAPAPTPAPKKKSMFDSSSDDSSIKKPAAGQKKKSFFDSDSDTDSS